MDCLPGTAWVYPANELHKIIIIDHCGGKEHKLKFQLLDRIICRVGLAILFFSFLLGFQALGSFRYTPQAPATDRQE